MTEPTNKREAGRGDSADIRSSKVMRVEFNLGYTCNNNCVFCGEGENRDKFQKQTKDLLTTENVKSDISSFARRGYKHITFLGGEPTIRKDFIEIIDHAKKEGFDTVFLTTNGRMFSRKSYLKAAISAGLTEICLSLHGADASAHDASTRSPGSFQQIRMAMDNLAEIGKEFSTSTVITKLNYMQMPDMVDLLGAYMTRRIYIAYPMVTGNALRLYNDVVVKFSDSRGYVAGAIDNAIRLDRMLTVGHVPFCQLGGRPGYADILYWGGEVKRVVKKYRGKGINPDGSIVDRHGASKVKKNVCRSCVYYFLCEGLDHRYAQRYGGGELEATPGEKITDPEVLKSATHFYNKIDVPVDKG